MSNMNELKAMYKQVVGTTGKRTDVVILDRIKREIQKGKDSYKVTSMSEDRKSFLEQNGFTVELGKVLYGHQWYIISGWAD